MIDFDTAVLRASHRAFGENVTFLPAAGSIVPGMSGIFFESYQTVKFVDGDSVTDSKPMLDMRASSFIGPLPQRNDVFLIRGRYWRVVDVEDDGEGCLHLQVGLADDAQVQVPPVPPVPPPVSAF